jgi:glycogen operon protein
MAAWEERGGEDGESAMLKPARNEELRGGARLIEGEGVEFALYSAHARKVELCLFGHDGEKERARFALHRHDDDIWRGFLPKEQGGREGLHYGYRAHGPFDPARGHRFNPAKLLVDPFARALSGPVVNHEALMGHASDDALKPDPRDSAPYVPKPIITGEAELAENVEGDGE